MFQIREEHKIALAAVARRTLMNRIMDHVRKYLPEYCISYTDTELSLIIDTGIQKAFDHGVTREREVCKYVQLMFLLGHDFEQIHPSIQRIVHNCKGRPDDLINELCTEAARMVAESSRT